MRFREIKTIEDAKNTSHNFFDDILKKGLILYIDSKSVIRILDVINFNIVFQKSLESIPFIQFCSGKIFLRNPEDTLYHLDYQNGNIDFFYKADKENDFDASVGLLSENIILESQSKYENYSLTERKSKLVDVESNTVLYSWDTIHDLIYLDNSLAFLQPRSGEELICRDIRTTEEKWLVNLDKGAQGKRIFGKSTLAIFVQRVVAKSSHFNVVALDKSKGSIIWELEDSFSFYNYDESNSKLYGLSGRTFEMIDVDKGEREIQHELSEDLHIVSYLTYYNNGYLYFSGYVDNRTPVFGAVDVESGELVFTQEVEMSGEKSFRKGLDRPIVVGNRLYVRDAMKTLHVYEREDHPS